MRVLLGLLLAAAAAATASAPAPTASCATADEVAAYQAALPQPAGRTKAQLRKRDALARSALSCASGRQLLPFFPQGGIVGRDLYLTNTVDLADGPGLRDPWCGTRTYDGHTGEDVVIRSFRELNRPPSPVTASLAGGVCTVAQDLVHEDPDYDIVRYRYVWRGGARVVRAVTSGRLADILRRTVRGEVTCTVTPGDGRLSGPTAQATG